MSHFFHFVQVPESVLRLLLSLLLGGVIGLERELRRRPAGLRTSSFICFGSALFTIVSESLAHEFGGDPQRIAAQIIPGIGFLGAGAILRERGSIAGLTSAATIFVVASIGMAAGGGMYLHAAFATLIVMAVLSGFGWLERRLRLKTASVTYIATGVNCSEMLAAISDLVDIQHHALSYMRTQPVGSDFLMEFGVSMRTGAQSSFLRALRDMPQFAHVACTTFSESGK